MLNSVEKVSEKIGNLEFQYCPACLRPLGERDELHCIVCHSEIDRDDVKSKYFEIRIDNELQIRESGELLKSKSQQVEELQIEVRRLRRRYTNEVAEFSDRYDVSNSPRESFLAERNRLVGGLERELSYLEEIRMTLEKIDKLSKERASLNDEISSLESRLAQLSAAASSRLAKAMKAVGEIGRRLLKGDLPRENSFEDPVTFSINFGDDAMLVDGKMNFAESSNVILKNSSIVSLFLGAGSDSEFWHPKFLLMDNVEDKGMEIERSHNFQRLIVAESSKLKVPHQIIFTTSMIAPELEKSGYTVGPKYTRQNKSLANV